MTSSLAENILSAWRLQTLQQPPRRWSNGLTCMFVNIGKIWCTMSRVSRFWRPVTVNYRQLWIQWDEEH